MTGQALKDDLAALEDLPPARLREAWTDRTGRPVPKVSPSLLRLALAFELQARAQGGLSRRSQQLLDQWDAAKTRTRAPQPGMRLMREWNGTLHVVTIDEDGAILWKNERWASLSKVARAITGTRWSGPAFFGLKQPCKAAA